MHILPSSSVARQQPLANPPETANNRGAMGNQGTEQSNANNPPSASLYTIPTLAPSPNTPLHTDPRGPPQQQSPPPVAAEQHKKPASTRTRQFPSQ